jgi:hypothetical protein
VFTVASKFVAALQRRPVLLLLLVAAVLVAGLLGWAHPFGQWDGPI